ncbi:hypothetical protein NH340_JMT07991 [Sarcoptes scabiei]|nr:hypothetical protein NH340_JMT07991 [Sarcoptes scabiei]
MIDDSVEIIKVIEPKTKCNFMNNLDPFGNKFEIDDVDDDFVPILLDFNDGIVFWGQITDEERALMNYQDTKNQQYNINYDECMILDDKDDVNHLETKTSKTSDIDECDAGDDLEPALEVIETKLLVKMRNNIRLVCNKWIVSKFDSKTKFDCEDRTIKPITVKPLRNRFGIKYRKTNRTALQQDDDTIRINRKRQNERKHRKKNKRDSLTFYQPRTLKNLLQRRSSLNQDNDDYQNLAKEENKILKQEKSIPNRSKRNDSVQMQRKSLLIAQTLTKITEEKTGEGFSSTSSSSSTISRRLSFTKSFKTRQLIESRSSTKSNQSSNQIVQDHQKQEKRTKAEVIVESSNKQPTAETISTPKSRPTRLSIYGRPSLRNYRIVPPTPKWNINHLGCSTPIMLRS